MAPWLLFTSIDPWPTVDEPT